MTRLITVVLLGALVLSAGLAEAAGLRLNWTDASTNEANFHVDRKVGPATGPALWVDRYATVGAGIVTFNDAAASEGVEWCYRITASNPAGESVPSNVACATPPWTIPAIPTGLVVVPLP